MYNSLMVCDISMFSVADSSCIYSCSVCRREAQWSTSGTTTAHESGWTNSAVNLMPSQLALRRLKVCWCCITFSWNTNSVKITREKNLMNSKVNNEESMVHLKTKNVCLLWSDICRKVCYNTQAAATGDEWVCKGETLMTIQQNKHELLCWSRIIVHFIFRWFTLFP